MTQLYAAPRMVRFIESTTPGSLAVGKWGMRVVERQGVSVLPEEKSSVEGWWWWFAQQCECTLTWLRWQILLYVF